MTTANFDKIIARLTEPILDPPRPPPKPRKTWAGLKAGDFIQTTNDTRFTVKLCDSRGVWITSLNGQGQHRLESKDGWRKVPKGEAKRKGWIK